MTSRRLLLALAVVAFVALWAWPRPRSDGFASYEIAPSSLKPGPLIKLHSYNGYYPLGDAADHQSQTLNKKNMLARTPGVFRKMLMPGTPKFAIRNERNGLFLTAAPKTVYGRPTAGWGPQATLWTAEPAPPSACLGRPSFVHLKDDTGRVLKYGTFGLTTKKGCSKQDPDCNQTSRELYVQTPRPEDGYMSCWMP